ncbi:acetyl-CoA carboxylase biotin carboxyl carrier protein subunit [Nocardia sp. CA2R105]|uniref:acetyl-CoA carboxylase biotin carboxyl carrier protein n=1 Tax=Nocardia coffeae TaxID=2873381 RepID=UPI001CA6329C|nr:biotin/lipoyl-containing protein [Nocardia coffeae]MBY8857249.1 acetyl-CoA carboxylase biotin carboxyl carrier protein subunit [Nocardia coffeae]
MSTSTHQESSGDGAPRIGPEEIGELLRTFAGSGWTGMHVKIGDVTVSVGKDAPPPALASASAAPAAPVPTVEQAPARAVSAPPPAPAARTTSAPTTAEIDESGLVPVTAPTVGAFWTAPDPGSPPFVEVGTHVEPGDQLAIVEVMKLMNPVVSDVSGQIVAIRARNAEMVEFGQPLFLIRPDE